jgi:hypothetical protein
LAKGFKDSDGKFHPIQNKNGVRKSRDQNVKSQGIKVRKKKDVELDVSNPLNENTTPRRTKAMLMKLDMKDPVLTEKEINWMKNNINGSFMNSKGKTNEFGMKVQEIINNREGGYRITDEQSQKGFDWLKKKPQQNMMGFREKDIVDNFDDYKLESFYDAGNSFRSFFVPLWKVRSKPDKEGHRGTMLYYNSGGMQIIG